MYHRWFHSGFAWLVLLAAPVAACAGSPDTIDKPGSDVPPDQEDPIGYCPPCSPGQHCESGACVEDPCGPSNCATGCCSAGTCVSGTSRSACGTGGGLCDACASDESCDSDEHRCTAAATAGDAGTSCNSTTCPKGCCDGTSCRTTFDDSHCGSGGASCGACGSTQNCEVTSGIAQCVDQAAATYQVTLVSASVSAKKSSGSNWDTTTDAGCLSCVIGCCPPDVYVSDSSQIAGLSVPKVVESNTTSPTWNLIVGQVPEKSLVGASVTVELKDEDTSVLPDDSIGTCTTTITANDVSTGMLMLSPSRGCTGSIQNVTFRLDEI